MAILDRLYNKYGLKIFGLHPKELCNGMGSLFGSGDKEAILLFFSGSMFVLLFGHGMMGGYRY